MKEFGILIILILLYTLLLNFKFTKKRYTISSNKVAERTKVVFFSDLHLKQYGKNNSCLLHEIKKESPDYIFIGGDLITTYPIAYHGVRGDYKWLGVIVQFLCELNKVCPIYYVDGNHEVNLKTALDGAYNDIYTKYIAAIKEAGVNIINDNKADLSNNIRIYGLVQPIELFQKRQHSSLELSDIYSRIDLSSFSKYNILLTHNPQYFDKYSDWGADLVLSGHTHGGVIRFGQKGLIAPSYKLFPEYCYGRYKFGQSNMIVSSGLNMHTFPIRWFNPAEFVIVEIVSA